jgi:hypothetical protein
MESLIHDGKRNHPQRADWAYRGPMPTPVPAGAAPVAAVPARCCWLLKAQSLTL